jgi:hypothetical protein
MYKCHIFASAFFIFIDCPLHCHDVHLHPSVIFVSHFFSINISHGGVSNLCRLNGERRFLDLDSNINFAFSNFKNFLMTSFALHDVVMFA